MDILPEILCGPFVRRLESKLLVIWFVSSQRHRYNLHLLPEQVGASNELETVQIGQHCYVNQFITHFAEEHEGFAQDSEIQYQISKPATDKVHLLDLSAHALAGHEQPNFILASKLSTVIQGSCRKPHHHAPDAFVEVANKLANKEIDRPDYLVMSGDQIYADDIAGPMLVAIQSLSKKLGLYTATHELGSLSKQQLDWRFSMFGRSHILPKKQDQSRWSKFWHGDNIISSRYHDNHLIGLDEFFACYLLTWSSNCWKLVNDEVEAASAHVSSQHLDTYNKEWTILKDFVDSLPHFEKLMANLPTLMIFDDHDVTDDWNLTADWEKHVYGNTVTKHIIRDALVSYALFQGWGNCPEQTEPLINQIKQLSETDDFASEKLTDSIFEHNQWHYEVNTTPQIVVLDTRTHRWRSETSIKNPSGLMDWERLEHLQQELFKPQKSILVVSPAPVFGVKAIEVVQSGCEMIGQELLVDVENWMAHKGSAKKLMNMLRHDSAPDEVIILSGDVHYSFCFSAQRRFSSDTDKIWQLTCSGFKNEFPQGLINFFDSIDRFLYSKHSPLNLFTKRRKLAIEHHELELDSKRKKHLYSQSAAGLVKLTEEGYLKDFDLITGDGQLLSFDMEA